MASLVMPYPPLRPHGSSRAASSLCCRGSAPSRALTAPAEDAAGDGKRRRRYHDEAVPLPAKRRREGDDGSRPASPVAHLSCARIRPAVYASRPKEGDSKVRAARAVRRDDARGVIEKQQQKAASESGSWSCTRIKPAVQASRPEQGTQVTARAVRHDAHGVTTKQHEASEIVSYTGIRPAVQATRQQKEEIKVISRARVLRHDAHGLIRKKQEAGERVQASGTRSRSSPQLAQRPPPAKPDPAAAHDALRAALAIARQALHRKRDKTREELEEEREEARRQRDKVVRTVEFNDPYIAPDDVLKP